MTRVLLVDDDGALLRILGEGLRRHGFEVTPAQTVTAACALAGPWDILVLDRRLPDGDGLTVAGVWPSVPSVSISGGPHADLMKPFSVRELVAAIEDRLTGRRDHP